MQDSNIDDDKKSAECRSSCSDCSSISRNSAMTRKKHLYDRHVRRKISLEKYELTSSQSSSSTKNAKTAKQVKYKECLSSILIGKQSLRQFTISKSQSSHLSKCRFNHNVQALHNFHVQGWKNNYYTTLLDWSHNNFICVAYNTELYFYNMLHQDAFQKCLYRRYEVPVIGQTLTAVKFSPYDNKIVLGYSQGNMGIYDYVKEKVIQQQSKHQARIAALEWNQGLIFSGSKDRTLRMIDVRSYEETHKFGAAHCQQILGLKRLGNLLASGGNDNKVSIFDLRKCQQTLSTYKHKAAVKALAWIPAERKLVTGGGTADRKLKFWMESDIQSTQQIDTGSQICSLAVSKTTNQLVSCHGFSLNQIVVWNWSGEREITIHGHSSRVLYSAISPSGEYLATGAGDQTLKIWKLFPKIVEKNTLQFTQIR